jgi:hypothetical protein
MKNKRFIGILLTFVFILPLFNIIASAEDVNLAQNKNLKSSMTVR